MADNLALKCLARYALLILFLGNGLVGIEQVNAQPILEIRLHHDKHCPSAELNFGAEHLQALYSYDGPLSVLPDGVYPATLEFTPPINLVVHLPFAPTLTSGTTINIGQTTSGLGPENDGMLVSQRFAKHPRFLGKDLHNLSYVLSFGDGKDDKSAILGSRAKGWRPNGSYTLGGLNATLLTNKKTLPDVLLNWLSVPEAERGNYFKRDVQLRVIRPHTYKFVHSRGNFTRSASRWNEWTETLDGSLVHTYHLDYKNRFGFVLRDNAGGRVVTLPTGFQEAGDWAIEGREKKLYLVKRSDPVAPILKGPKFEISVKSYIARMETPAPEETEQNLGFDDADLPFVPISIRAQASIFQKATDALFSELPTSSSNLTSDYRLWSSISISPVCLAGRVSSWTVSPVATKFGTEAGLPAEGRVDYEAEVTGFPDQAPPGQLIVSREFILVRYRIAGSPNPGVLPPFNLIRPRTCTWIWHEVVARVDCDGDTPKVSVAVHGSSFPSHRIWANGELMQTVPQGRFEHLWICQHPDASRVR